MFIAEPLDASPTPAPGLSHERIGMFTDAVFAIAITLLVIDIKRPEEADLKRLGAFISEQAGAFIAFVIAFVMLWAAWRAHHMVFDQITRVSRPAVAVHLPLLLFAAFLPYPTGIFGEASSEPLAISMFAGTEAILMLCLATLMTLVLRQRLYAAHANTVRLAVHSVVYWGMGAYWALSAVIAWWAPGYVPLVWMATPLLAPALAKVGRRLHAPSRPVGSAPAND
ncbi:TMEM175 family protein [Sphaerisporangium perillae]|uniref:TMEM175 family protein n=1 Tax=Sphaerisporangium perillae TaxID=2935860 RepID=UPI00200DE913|nr:TMEM175 family protein [Sphaerisporangium perillae]